MSAEPRRVLYAAEVAQALGISERTLRRLRAFGTFPIRELGGLDSRPRWSREAVDRYLAESASRRPLRRVG